MIIARDYQEAAADSVFEYFSRKSGNPVIAMPTGTGKSVVIARLLWRIYSQYPNERVMVLTHVKELIEQNHAKLMSMWPGAPAGIYSAGLGRRDVQFPITFAGIASVAKRAAHFGHVGLVIVDEAHTVSTAEKTMYDNFIKELQKVNPWIKVIGLTATPWRLGHGKITEDGVFTDLCFDLTSEQCFTWLIQQGYLCPLIPKNTAAKLDTDGVHTRGGEFIASELAKAVDKDDKTREALREAVALAGDRWSWLLFCAGVEHSINTARILTELGIPCEAVHSDLSKTERDRILRDWKSGKLRAVANNNVLTTGIDHPALDCIVMLRPTMSTVLWVQMLGRGTRPFYASGYDLSTQQGRLDAIAASHKHNCLVLDFARNTPRLGPINDPVIPKKKGEAKGDAPVKLCQPCGTYNHASARFCMLCGQDFPVHGPKLSVTAGTQALVKGLDANPIVEVLKVDTVTYGKHFKHGKPPSMKVSYFCGLRRFQDFVCFEHQEEFPARKAREWWRARAPGPQGAMSPSPASTNDALLLAEHLKVPTHLRVHLNATPYPRVLATCFDGSAFGSIEPTEDRPDVSVNTTEPVPKGAVTLAPAEFDVSDDDIPF